MCSPCLLSRYPKGLGQYILEIDEYAIDSAITAVEGPSAQLNQILRYGKLRKINSSMRPGRGAWKNARNIKPNVEFVGVGIVKKGVIIVEVWTMKGVTVYPGQELYAPYSFPSARQLAKMVCRCSAVYYQG